MKSIWDWLFPSKEWLDNANRVNDMGVYPGWMIVLLVSGMIGLLVALVR
jgi:hypothetical protein